MLTTKARFRRTRSNVRFVNVDVAAVDVVIFPLGTVVIAVHVFVPHHFVLFLQAPASIREPCRHLGQSHFADDCQHDLFTLRRIRVLLVLLQPRFQRTRRLSRRVLPSSGRHICSVPSI